MKKRKPIVEKIVLSKEQLEDIDSIQHNKSTKAVVDKLIGKGWDIKKYTEHRVKQSPNNVFHKLKKEDFGGTCLRCSGWPAYMVLIDVGDGAQKREWYCEKHLPKF